MFISLGFLVASHGPHVVLAALFIFWQWHLRLFKFGGFPVTSVMEGSDFPESFTWFICVDTIAVTATSLAAVLGTCCSISCHFCN